MDYAEFVALLERAQSKQELRALLLSLVSHISSLSCEESIAECRNNLAIYEQIFLAFRSKILAIFDAGDILDSAFLYLALIAPPTLCHDARFAPFITSAKKLLTHAKQEEYLMLLELIAIATILASPANENLSRFHAKEHETSTQANNNGIEFFLMHVCLASIKGISAVRCGEFLIGLFSVPGIGLSFVIKAITSAFERALEDDNYALCVRHVCNWQLHVLWHAKNLFNHRDWLCLYPIWKDVFYQLVERVKVALINTAPSASATTSITSASLYSASHASAPISSAYTEISSALDIVLYMQFFLYHMCGNSFSTQEQWRCFHKEISTYSTDIYKQYTSLYLKAPNPHQAPSSRRIIGILRDRLVENSPFKVEYSLVKNLLANSAFTSLYTIKIYCMSLIEKSENDPRIIARFASLGVEVLDVGKHYNSANFYNSHLQKALALREALHNDDVALLLSPNNGYGISDFLLVSRSAPRQVFWTHGNFVYDVCGIDARLTHICNNQSFITHEGFTFYGIPVQMDREFYCPAVLQESITQARNRVITPQIKYILGVIGRLTKIDSEPYLRTICALLERHSDWGFLACGVGNERVIMEQIRRMNPRIAHRVLFSGYVDSAVYGHVLDFWADSFPMEQGESRIEYVAKARGLALRYYDMPKAQLESLLAEQLHATDTVLAEIIGSIRPTNKGGLLESYDMSIAHEALSFALDARVFSDAIEYKRVALAFLLEISACSESEYIEKASCIMRLQESTKSARGDASRWLQGLESRTLQENIALQSIIHAINSKIKARLGAAYFSRFLADMGLMPFI